MILIERGVHLLSKVNGSHGTFWLKAKEVKGERSISTEVDRHLGLLTPGAIAFNNRRVAYMGRFRGRKVEKTKMVRILHPFWQRRLDAGIVVTLTRYAEKALDDDNIRPAFKHYRDGVADSFGIADNDKRIRFVYADERGHSRITVQIEWQEGTDQ